MNEVKPISTYSSSTLLSETASLVKSEREITLKLIEHLREIEKRLLFAELGFGSLFEFTTKYLGLSEGSAHRRIAAMRLVRDMPEAKEKLKDGSLSLSNAAKIQVALKTVSKNAVSKKSAILDQCLNLSQKKCEEKLFEMIPALSSKKSFSETQKRVSLDLIELKLVITKELHEKIIHLNHQLSHSNPELAIAVLLERLVNQELKAQTKKKTVQKKTAPAARPAAGQNEIKRSETKAPAVPAATTRLIYTRANHRCEFENCGSTYQLQIEHIIPRALGGSNEESNLKLLCRTHNLLSAKKVFGPNQMKSFVISMRD